jgi:hypothetical protein
MMKRWAATLAVAAVLLAGASACDRQRDDRRGVEPELEALIDSILPRIGELAGLAVLGPVRLERRSRQEVRAFVEERLETELPPDELDGMRRTYVMLGLLPDTLDLHALLLDLYTEQVVGYYDPGTRRLYIVDGVPRAALRPVLVHELVHALQDQHTNIDSLIARERGSDRQTAAHAALEGHATLVMFAYLAQEAAGQPISPEMLPNPADEIAGAFEEQAANFPVFRGAPAIIRRSLLFPYVGGAGFVRELWLHRPTGSPRLAPLGDLLPQSTEQVVNPVERFIRNRSAPVELRFGDVAPGWTAAYENTLGAFETQVLLEEMIGPGALSPPIGWAGDRYRLLRSDAGTHALVMASVWLDAGAADRFAGRLQQVAERVAGVDASVRRVEIDGLPGVLAVLADGGIDPAAVPRLVPFVLIETVEVPHGG